MATLNYHLVLEYDGIPHTVVVPYDPAPVDPIDSYYRHTKSHVPPSPPLKNVVEAIREQFANQRDIKVTAKSQPYRDFEPISDKVLNLPSVADSVGGCTLRCLPYALSDVNKPVLYTVTLDTGEGSEPTIIGPLNIADLAKEIAAKYLGQWRPFLCNDGQIPLSVMLAWYDGNNQWNFANLGVDPIDTLPSLAEMGDSSPFELTFNFTNPRNWNYLPEHPAVLGYKPITVQFQALIQNVVIPDMDFSVIRIYDGPSHLSNNREIFDLPWRLVDGDYVAGLPKSSASTATAQRYSYTPVNFEGSDNSRTILHSIEFSGIKGTLRIPKLTTLQTQALTRGLTQHQGDDGLYANLNEYFPWTVVLDFDKDVRTTNDSYGVATT